MRWASTRQRERDREPDREGDERQLDVLDEVDLSPFEPLQFDLSQSGQKKSLFLTQLDVVPKVGMTGPASSRGPEHRGQPFARSGPT